LRCKNRAAPGPCGAGADGLSSAELLDGGRRRDGGGDRVDVGEGLAVGGREKDRDRQDEPGDDVVGLDAAGHGGS